MLRHILAAAFLVLPVCAAPAKAALSSLVFGKDVVVRVTGHDKYRRTLGRVTVDGKDVNLEMVQSGFAWHFVKYSKDSALAAAQAEAKAGKRGLWNDPAPVAPWDYRKTEKGK